jgi:polysaccharide export outer membrane protein
MPLLLMALTMGLSTIGASRDAQEAQQSSSARATGAACRPVVKVTGAVRAPARLELRRRVRLREALAVVGGLTELAGKQVQITHAAQDAECGEPTAVEMDKSSGSRVESFEVAALLRADDEKLNPYLRPGDVVAVSEVGVAYIVGGVARPQPIILREPISITQAIALAGGILPDVGTDGIYVYRYVAGQAARTRIHVSLKAIRKGRAEDTLLQPYDIVEVRDSRGRLLPPPLFPDVPRPPAAAGGEAELPLRIVY